MNVIRPTCRDRFTAADFDFILTVLGTDPQKRAGVERLVRDRQSLDLILEQEKLFQALLEERVLLRVSPQFYFYVLVRQVLMRAGCEDRAVADYVAALLAEFASARRVRFPVESSDQPMDYLVDLLQGIREADESKRFLLMLHLGNYALFLSGIFSDHIRERARRRAAPGLEYYEALGSSHFRAASDHHLASRYDLGPVLSTLAEEFRPTRRVLNDLSERLLFWNEAELP